MKKRSRIAEVIMAIIFIAATASAGGVYYTQLVPKTFECLVFEIDLHQLRAVEAVDKKARSTFIRSLCRENLRKFSITATHLAADSFSAGTRKPPTEQVLQVLENPAKP